ncbi:hypothetical protein M427DRAFT_62642, partial [Gonapodya prolifera JEL478]
IEPAASTDSINSSSMDEWEDIADDFDVLSLDSAISGALSVAGPTDAPSAPLAADDTRHPAVETEIPVDGSVNPPHSRSSTPSHSATGSADQRPANTDSHPHPHLHPATDPTHHDWTDGDPTQRPGARAFGRLRFGVRSNKTRTGEGKPNCGPDCRWCIPERARKIKWRHRKWDWEMREIMRER